MIMFHNYSLFKNEINKISNVFCHFRINIGFLMKEKLKSTKLFCDKCVSESIVMRQQPPNTGSFPKYLVKSQSLREVLS
jgi:hypothetical protein